MEVVEKEEVVRPEVKNDQKTPLDSCLFVLEHPTAVQTNWQFRPTGSSDQLQPQLSTLNTHREPTGFMHMRCGLQIVLIINT